MVRRRRVPPTAISGRLPITRSSNCCAVPPKVSRNRGRLRQGTRRCVTRGYGWSPVRPNWPGTSPFRRIRSGWWCSRTAAAAAATARETDTSLACSTRPGWARCFSVLVCEVVRDCRLTRTTDIRRDAPVLRRRALDPVGCAAVAQAEEEEEEEEEETCHSPGPDDRSARGKAAGQSQLLPSCRSRSVGYA